MAQKSAIRSFFASARLAIILISLLAFFALLGTLIPQREAAQELALRLPPALFSFLDKIQIFDLYSSVWFFLLSALLAVNIVVCSLERFSMAWRRFRLRPALNQENVFKAVPPENRLQCAGDVQQAARTVEALLKKKYGKTERADESGKVFFSVTKGRFSLFSVYIIHLSILFFIGGAVISSVFGVEGYLNLAEGETADTISLRGKDKTMALPFSVRCDKFSLERYENGMPRTFQSDLTFLKENSVWRAEKLLVNHPLEMEGFRFYQASYGFAPGGKATLSLRREDGTLETMNVAQSYLFELPGQEGNFQVLRVEQNLMEMGPAVKIAVRSEKGETFFWVFQHIDEILKMNPDIFEQVPVFNPSLFRPYTFILLGLEEKYYTGLQVNRDPGTPVMAAAAVLLVCGLLLFLFSYQRFIRIRVERQDEQTQIFVWGRSYKNSGALQSELRSLIAQLKVHLESLP